MSSTLAPRCWYTKANTCVALWCSLAPFMYYYSSKGGGTTCSRKCLLSLIRIPSNRRAQIPARRIVASVQYIDDACRDIAAATHRGSYGQENHFSPWRIRLVLLDSDRPIGFREPGALRPERKLFKLAPCSQVNNVLVCFRRCSSRISSSSGGCTLSGAATGRSLSCP